MKRATKEGKYRMIEMYIVYTVPRPCVRVGARDAQASSTVCSRAGRSVAPFQFQFPKAFSRVSIAGTLPRIGSARDQSPLSNSQGLFQSFSCRVFPSLQAKSARQTNLVLPIHWSGRPSRRQWDSASIGSASLQRVTSTVSNFAASRHIPAAR